MNPYLAGKIAGLEAAAAGASSLIVTMKLDEGEGRTVALILRDSYSMAANLLSLE